VQFAYLFALVGLPEGMTYANYAREGFVQTLVVCGINLVLFGVFMQIGKGKALRWLLDALMGLTLVMLLSGAMRLNLYIGAFGFTWLRLLSGWFMVFLAVVVLLCVLKTVPRFRQLPVLGISMLVLLGWYVALGFLNPDGFIAWYNQVVLA